MLITDLTSEQLVMLAIPALPNLFALRHAMHHDFPTEKQKVRWMTACIFLPCIGGIAYYLVGKKHASKEKINVFERYGKKKPGDAAAENAVAAEAVENVEPAVEAAPAAIPSVLAEGEVLSEGRARAPWDEPETEVRPEAAKPSAPAGQWDFGCPEDLRK